MSHFFLTSANGSTKISTETPDVHVFVQNPPLNHLWIFFPIPFNPDQLSDWLAHHLPNNPAGRAFNAWTVNCYNKEMALKLYKEWKATSFDILYEMNLPSSPAVRAGSPCSDGFLIREDPSFLKSREPGRVSEAFMDREHTLTVVDEKTGNVAGFATLISDDDTKRKYISSIEVFPSYRRRGLALALMKRGMESDKEGYTIWLTVFAENIGAVALYFGLGFRIHRCLWVVGGTNP
ncbi:hypothetical protein DACRYDRAFT_17402 [Dacryopinax primogenitus]|uniref:N-acetyltransferase domain-containing protein n=1 Tax=Dacryopinax primogenitus (strain DJM 731) TaxID=1858805 RepID=M5FT46_DACPD|nr:uncharacterized protein DACRYDRAFT_17402 [Dacryopinax primogenitus]EJT99173.1 hypothetical protein DACRYDRAFT_17402 [Dacryopinax primogenitus]